MVVVVSVLPPPPESCKALVELKIPDSNSAFRNVLLPTPDSPTAITVNACFCSGKQFGRLANPTSSRVREEEKKKGRENENEGER